MMFLVSNFVTKSCDKLFSISSSADYFLLLPKELKATVMGKSKFFLSLENIV